AADAMDFVEGPDVLLRERAVLSTDHCYFGARFANLNNLPAALVSAVQFHHTPEWAEEHKPLVALVAVADHMANYFQREQRVEGYDATANPAWPVLQQYVPAGRDFVELADGVFMEAVDEGEVADGGTAA